MTTDISSAESPKKIHFRKLLHQQENSSKQEGPPELVVVSLALFAASMSCQRESVGGSKPFGGARNATCRCAGAAELARMVGGS